MRKLTARNLICECHRHVEAAQNCNQAICLKKEKPLAKGTMTLPLYWGDPCKGTKLQKLPKGN